MCTTSIKANAGIDNFAALLIRDDHPRMVEVINEFTLTAKILRDNSSRLLRLLIGKTMRLCFSDN